MKSRMGKNSNEVNKGPRLARRDHMGRVLTVVEYSNLMKKKQETGEQMWNDKDQSYKPRFVVDGFEGGEGGDDM